MGKIRVTTFGDEAAEAEKKQKNAIKKAARLASKRDSESRQEKLNREKSTSASSADGSGEKAREEASAPVEEEKAETPIQETTEASTGENQTEKLSEAKSADRRTKKEKFAKKEKKRSAIYAANLIKIDTNKNYSINDGIELLKSFQKAKFDETVELHINTIEAGISGNVKLPHGTGKEIRAVVATDEILAEVEKGKINFDILIAEPSMMPKLGKVAKVLGPRGLMPNPKNGTITSDPEAALKNFKGGQVNFKTENKVPVMHVSVGKLSFENDKLSENIKVMITTVKKSRISQVVLKSTMSPAIKLQV